MVTTVALVCAPGVPQSEADQLEIHVLESLRDPDYKIITNYDFTVYKLDPNKIGSSYFTLTGHTPAVLAQFQAQLRLLEDGIKTVVVFPHSFKVVKPRKR